VIYLLGEAMLEQSGETAGPANTAVAGDSYNTAVGLAQLGQTARFVSALGTDRDSKAILTDCQHWGVGTELIATMTDRRPGRYTIHLDPQGERSFSYDRDNSAARALFSDTNLLRAQLEKIEPAQWIYLTGITLAIANPACRELLMAFLANYRAAGGHVAFDCNHRPPLWHSPEQARSCYRAALTHCDLFFAGEEDLCSAWQIAPAAAAGTVTDMALPLAVLKRGGNNTLLISEGQREEIPLQRETQIVDSTGAGDIFNAGFLAGIMQGAGLAAAASFAQRLGAECLKHHGALLPATSWQQFREYRWHD
jgi:2-dehydro-3-deoxygluconokinase